MILIQGGGMFFLISRKEENKKNKDKEYLKLVVPVSICQTALWGVLYYSFSLFIIPMHNTLNWSTERLTFGYSLAILISGLLAIPLGRWVDLNGARNVLVVGSFGAGIAIIMQSLSHGYFTYLALWSVIGITMAFTLQTVNVVFVQHVSNSLHKAVIVSSLFTGMSATIFIPFTQYFIDKYDWRLSFIPLSIICLICGLIFMRIIPKGNGNIPNVKDQTKEKKRLLETLSKWRLWGIIIALSSNSGISTSLALLLIPILKSKGYEPSQITLAFMILGPSQIFVRLILALKKDINSNFNLGVLALSLQTVSLIALFYSDGNSSLSWLIYVFSFSNGLTGGLTLIVGSLITTEVAELKHYGLIQGILKTSTTLARSLLPYTLSIISSFSYTKDPSTKFLIIISIFSLFSFISVVRKNKI
jgi:predicted MFS family arabinose efflux permease